MNEIKLVDIYSNYLIEHGVHFNKNGFPVFKNDWMIIDKPLIIAPFSKRKYYHENKKNISICFFENDNFLYPRLNKVFDEIEVFKEYHSVCMMDISISPLMLGEVKK